MVAMCVQTRGIKATQTPPRKGRQTTLCHPDASFNFTGQEHGNWLYCCRAYLVMQERKTDSSWQVSRARPQQTLGGTNSGKPSGGQEWFSIRTTGGHVAALPRQTAVL